MSKPCIIFLLLCIIQRIDSNALSDITSNIFNSAIGDFVAAFGDFNSDKLTDIFVLTEKGQQLELLLAKENKDPFERVVLLKKKSNGTAISSVVPGDYDGDTQMDVLLTRKQDDHVMVEICWGEDGKLGDSVTVAEMRDHPLVFDWDADMIPDLLGETTETPPQRTRWFTVEADRRNFQSKPVEQPDGAFRMPHSNAFLDVTDDLTADLIVTTEKSLEVWTNQDGQLTYNASHSFPSDANMHIGQSVWEDINQDSEPEHLVPVCRNVNCSDSAIYIHHNQKWIPLTSGNTFVDDNKDVYGFVKADDNPAASIAGLQLPVTLRMGDIDMDGYPDAVAILAKKTGAKQGARAFMLMNVPCNSVNCQDVGRTFNVLWNKPISDVDNAMLVTFFDFYEDGVMDILSVVGTKQKDEETVALRAYKNMYLADACFLKITVLSGHCFNACPGGRSPYGNNQPGPAIKYSTTKPNGAPTQGCASQLSQSAHFALQLPYITFGLGVMPNFVDKLSAGIPTPDSLPRVKTWPQIIPNSQLIIVPHPNNVPSSWFMKLYVTPSEAILVTGAVLLGTLGLTAAILGGLHWKERKEDKEEKKQEAQKFHFDAM